MLSSFVVVISTLEGLPGCVDLRSCNEGSNLEWLGNFCRLNQLLLVLEDPPRLGKERSVSTMVSRLLVDLNEG